MNLAAGDAAPRISTAGLRRALIAGARRVIAEREQLDRMNVFPVPDGDTGSNLAFTLHSVLAGALSRPAASAGQLLRAVASDALDGARGNSGAILAQFFHGVGETLDADAELDRRRLAEAVRAGAEQARLALAEPREGTILSVIRAFAEALDHSACDLREWFGHALERARRALADTPTQLAVLRQAGVVDAGGQGFVDLLEGIAEFIDSGRLPRQHEHPGLAEAPMAEPVDSDADPRHRWCSECMIEGERLSRDAIRDAVLAAGASSLVIAGGAQRLRLHAHVADPAALFALATRFGRVTARKADDMHAQQRAVAHGERVAVVTDSGADLPPEQIEASGLSVVPVRLNFGEEDFLDKITMMPSEFYARVRAGGELPKTSQPPPGDFRRQFDVLLSHHADVVYVGLSRAVSGTLQSAESAAARSEGARVHVHDSGHASCGQGLIALAVAEAAARGADAAELGALAAELRARTHTFAAARDIGHAVRGGRVPRWIGPVATRLPLTPVARMRDDGRLGVVGVLFGREDVPAKFARYVARRLPRGRRWRLLVGHCDAAADGEVLLASLQARLTADSAWLVEVGPAVGAHAGPGTLVVAVQELEG